VTVEPEIVVTLQGMQTQSTDTNCFHQRRRESCFAEAYIGRGFYSLSRGFNIAEMHPAGPSAGRGISAWASGAFWEGGSSRNGVFEDRHALKGMEVLGL
jgi:hypothetical protein